MKTALLLGYVLLASVKSFAQEVCPHRLVKSTGMIHVTPIYVGKVIYFFDDIEKKAHAEVAFALDSEATRDCFKSIQQSNPKFEIKLAHFEFKNLKVQVFKGLREGEFVLYPEPGGFFHGATEMPVSYKSKAQIKKAIEEKIDLVKVIGEIGYEYTELEREEVVELDCLSNNSNLRSIERLHQRLGEVITELSMSNPRGQIAKEEALDLFMTKCVEVKEVEASSFSMFEKQLLRKMKLVEGKIPVFAIRKVSHFQKIELLNKQESSYLEY